MTTIYCDHDFDGKYELYLDREKSVIQIISEYELGEGEFYHSSIDLKNKNKLIWTGWSGTFTDEPKWVKFYIETARRIN